MTTLHSPKLQRHWDVTIRLFRVIFKTLVVGGCLTSLQRYIRCILQHQPTELALVEFISKCRHNNQFLMYRLPLDKPLVYSPLFRQPHIYIYIYIPSSVKLLFFGSLYIYIYIYIFVSLCVYVCVCAFFQI